MESSYTPLILIYVKGIKKSSGNEGSRIVANVLNCDIVVREFKLQSWYCIDFRTNTIGKDMNALIASVMDLRLALLFFYKGGAGIK